MMAEFRRFNTKKEAWAYALANPGTIFRDADGNDARHRPEWSSLGVALWEVRADEWCPAEPTFPLFAPAPCGPLFARLRGEPGPSVRHFLVAPDGEELPIDPPPLGVIIEFLGYMDKTLKWATQLSDAAAARKAFFEFATERSEPRDYGVLSTHAAVEFSMEARPWDLFFDAKFKPFSLPKDAFDYELPVLQVSRDPRQAEVPTRPKPPTLEERIRAVVPVELGVVGRSPDDNEAAFFLAGYWRSSGGLYPRDEVVPDIHHPATQGIMMAEIRKVFPSGFCCYDRDDGEWLLSLDAFTDWRAPTLGEALLRGLELLVREEM